MKFHIPENLAGIDEKTKTILKNTGETRPVVKSIHPDLRVNIDCGKWGN